MTVREATAADVPRVVEMALEFARTSEFRVLGAPDEAKVTAVVTGLLGAGVIYVAQSRDALVGMIGGWVFDHPMFDCRMAIEVAWWVSPESRGSAGPRLIAAFEQWASGQEATHLSMVAPNDRVGELYRRRGYHRLESQYVRRVQ